MVYVDTSVIVTLYVKEEYSRKAADWIRNNDESIPLTPFHELEFSNAVNLKLFRKELTETEAELIFSRLIEHQQRGVFYQPLINWPEIMPRSIALSKRNTPVLGSRSLDIVHVALALSIRANRFLTFDERQSRLAAAVGLQVITHTFYDGSNNSI